MPKDEVLPDKILLRRLNFISPDGKENMVLYTTLLNREIPKIVHKELVSTFIAYNLIRILIWQSTKGTAFSPEGDIIQEFFESNKELFIDRKGRVYKRWSPGR